MSTDKKRVSQFSYIRVISCFAIVLLHCINTARAYYMDGLSASGLTSVYTACSILMWPVPCFLMVTGALLLDPSRELKASKLFGKYIRRMVCALLVFTLIFTLIKYMSGESDNFFGFFVDNLLHDRAMPHLWYLYLMIVLYLLMPLFKLIVDKLSEHSLWIITGAVLLIVSVLPMGEYLGMEGLNAYLPTFIIYPTYLFIGYLVYGRNPSALLSTVLLAASTIALAALTYSMRSRGIDAGLISSYNSILVVLQATSAYSLMLRIKAEAGKWIQSLDECSFGIYLIHMIFIRLTMKEMGFNPFDFGPFAFLPMAILFFALSYAVALPIKKATGSAVI